MQISFHRPRSKVKRAYKHIEELEAWLRDLVQSNINTVLSHKDQNPGSESYTIDIQRPQSFFEDTALIVGDVVHNLRTSLDHIAFTIICTGIANNIIKPCEIDPTKIYFPLQDAWESLIKTPTYRFIERVSPDLAKIICDVVIPNMTGDGKLWGLNRLDRIDKHRLLIPTITQSTHLVIAIREEQEDDPPTAPAGATFMIGGITTSDGTMIQVAREPRIGTRAYIHNQRNGYPSVEIKFGKGEAFEDKPITPTLRELAEFISSTINKLEARCE